METTHKGPTATAPDDTLNADFKFVVTDEHGMQLGEGPNVEPTPSCPWQ